MSILAAPKVTVDSAFMVRIFFSEPLPQLEHVVPLALYLADQDVEGTNGQVISATKWNEENGHGAPEAWVYEADCDDAEVRRPGR